MRERLAAMRDHVIVCGYGRMGRLVCHDLETAQVRYVVVEKEARLLEEFPGRSGLPLHGDATADDILRQAGIERARALVTVVGSDADNLYVTMSARLLRDKLLIVARAEDERSEPKLLRAGATRVVSPYVIGGARVAQAVLRPAVVDFIELATRSAHLELQIEETAIAGGSPLAGVSFAAADLNRKLGVIVVGIKRSSGDMVFNPPAEARLEAGDVLIALGSRAGLDRLEGLAKGE
jgi:voltage-gated potassium channel